MNRQITGCGPQSDKVVDYYTTMVDDLVEFRGRLWTEMLCPPWSHHQRSGHFTWQNFRPSTHWSGEYNPFLIGGAQKPSTPGNRFFPNQDVTQQQTARIPQDLTSFVTANTITQAMLDDPNIVLRNHLAGLNVESFVTLVITTDSSGTAPHTAT